MSIARRALADGLGTPLLLAVVVGSGIMVADRTFSPSRRSQT